MTDAIWFNIYVSVKEGRLEDFKLIAKEWSAHHLTERPDISSYQWFFKEGDETKAQIMEIYESSESMLAAMPERAAEGEEEPEEPDYPYEMIKIEVCGNVSDALRKWLDAGESKIEYFRRIEGYTR